MEASHVENESRSDSMRRDVAQLEILLFEYTCSTLRFRVTLENGLPLGLQI